PDTGNVYLLLWVDKHDAAYDWARRHRCAVNDATGSLQLYEVVHDEAAAAQESSAKDDEAPQPLLQCRGRELLRLGVPQDRLARVQAATLLSELEAMKAQLPVEAFEAVCFLADGIPLDEVMAEYAQPDSFQVD